MVYVQAVLVVQPFLVCPENHSFQACLEHLGNPGNREDNCTALIFCSVSNKEKIDMTIRTYLLSLEPWQSRNSIHTIHPITSISSRNTLNSNHSTYESKRKKGYRKKIVLTSTPGNPSVPFSPGTPSTPGAPIQPFGPWGNRKATLHQCTYQSRSQYYTVLKNLSKTITISHLTYIRTYLLSRTTGITNVAFDSFWSNWSL